MNFADEPYIRIYTRDTKTWLKLGFEGQSVLVLISRKLDRSGVLDGIDDPAEDVALILRAPVETVRIGLERLFALRVLELHGNRLIAPNYIEAQTCAKSDRLRQQELRERRRTETLGLPEAEPAPVTKRDEPSRDVTPVTDRHAPSQDVTLICALPSLTVRGSERAPPHVASPEPERDPEVLVPTRRRSRFAPEDFEPTELHRVRCQELRLDVGEIVRAFKLCEFQRDYSDWDRRFSSWIEDERVKRETARANPSAPRASPGFAGNDLDTTGAATVFRPSDDDRKFATAHALDLDRAVKDYRASSRARALDTPTQARDFSNRLKCWHVTGQWIVDGALPKNPLPKRRGTEAA
jgi:hypothetical protein